MRITLQKYELQTWLPYTLLVIDNASNDGTFDFLEEWKLESGGFERRVVHNESNCGGAGGFAIGIAEAMKGSYEFIFLADDDAIPDNNMLERLLRCYNKINDKEDIAALCTRVDDQYGISCVHRARVKKGLFSIRRGSTKRIDYQKEYFEIDLLTFVGALIKKETVERVGLPIADYFIHEDDAEYSTRIRKIGKIICVSDSIMTHPFGGNETKPWIEYYTTRNYIDYIGRHYPRRYQVYAEFDKYIKKCSIIAGIVKHRSIGYREINKTAIKDGKNGKLGISEICKPGMEIKS